ncbi:MAG: hypothetical protein RL033_7468, partial [Pseudomonadota bacterium]
MKHRGVSRWAHAFFTVIVGCLFAGTTLAITITEPPDHANTGNGTAYSLTLGSNSVSGSINTSNENQDRFQVTVPAGQQLTAVSWTFAGSNPSPQGQFATFNTNGVLTSNGSFDSSSGLPLSAGTYPILVNANFAIGNAWSMSFTTIAAAVCGNGSLEGSETCDDNNTTSSDGCNSSCATESGFSCTGVTCTPICG